MDYDDLTIAEAAELLKLSATYTRTLVQSGKLKSRMVPVQEGSDVKRYSISIVDIDQWNETAQRRNVRTDGSNKYNFYATPPEYKKAVQVLKQNGLKDVAMLIAPANIRKPE